MLEDTTIGLADRSDYGDRFRHLIRSITGISLPASKVRMIDQRLRRRVVAFQLPSTEDYLQMLLEQPGMELELREVIDLITTNTTSFFREAGHFDFLAETILPEVLAKPVAGRLPRLKIWSAASSEGAEAYTAAMVLADQQRRGRAFDFAILGTDISGRMLEKAQAAVYSREQLASVPVEMKRRYFLASSDPEFAGQLRVAPELRARVRFRHLNLMDKAYRLDRDVSVIFLRNILIYFDAEDQARVVARLADHLSPGGYLIVGHSESMIVNHPSLEHVKPTIFRKI